MMTTKSLVLRRATNLTRTSCGRQTPPLTTHLGRNNPKRQRCSLTSRTWAMLRRSYSLNQVLIRSKAATPNSEWMLTRAEDRWWAVKTSDLQPYQVMTYRSTIKEAILPSSRHVFHHQGHQLLGVFLTLREEKSTIKWQRHGNPWQALSEATDAVSTVCMIWGRLPWITARRC